MPIAYYVGWILLLAAFAAAAAEVLVRSGDDVSTFIVAAHDLWYTVWPSGLLILQIRLEAISMFLWDPFVLTLLTMPAWLLLGGPGFLCVVVFRPRRPDEEKRLEEARKQEEQFLLYDELAKQASIQGFDQEGDDMRPQHSGHEIFLNRNKDKIEQADKLNKFFINVGVEAEQKKTISESSPNLQNPELADPKHEP